MNEEQDLDRIRQPFYKTLRFCCVIKCCQIIDLPHHGIEVHMNMIYGQIYIAQDIQSKMLLLLPIDIEDCAYISLYIPDTRERIVSDSSIMSLITSCITTGMYLSF